MEDDKIIHPDIERRFDEQKLAFKEEITTFAKRANTVFDSRDRQKTLFLAIDEYLLDFLQLVVSDNRAHTTLEKWMGRKRRYKQFLCYRYGKEDIALADLQFSFLQELVKYLVVNYEVIENTAMKYAQCIKEIMERAVSKGWLPANIFSIFQCRYDETDAKWPTLEQVQSLIQTVFSRNKLNEIRDIFIFQCFTGLSCAEMRRLSACHIIAGMDGRQWISIKRQKTDGDETVPLLPIALEILEKYKEHPTCVRRKKLLPVPSNEEYNRCLKDINDEAALSILLHTHLARYFFANVVMFDNGIQLKTIGDALGQKSIATTARYVKKNKGRISKAIGAIQEAMFSKDGKLLGLSGKYQLENKDNNNLNSGRQEAKVIIMATGKAFSSKDD